MESLEKNNDIEINIFDMLAIIWSKKWLIITVTILFSISTYIYTLTVANVYISETTLSPSGGSNSNAISGQLSGIAAIAGINLGSNTGLDKTAIAIELLQSRDFLFDFIIENEIEQALFSAKGWDPIKNELLYTEGSFEERTHIWEKQNSLLGADDVRKVELSSLLRDRLTVVRDKETGVVKLKLEFYSPYFAKLWLKQIVTKINRNFREKELAEAKSSITYLNEQLQVTKLTEVNAMLYNLIEEQTKKVMLATVKDGYVFEIIDPPAIMYNIVKPKRVLITLVVGLLSGLITVLFIFSFGLVKAHES